MNEGRKIRVLLGKLGLDCHDTGITTMAHMLREKGFEVVYMGLHNTAEGLYNAARQEGADVIGISFLSGEHLPHMRKLMGLIGKDEGLRVMIGGVIPKSDIPGLMKMGVGRVFPPGTMHWDVVDFIKARNGEVKEASGDS